MTTTEYAALVLGTGKHTDDLRALDQLYVKSRGFSPRRALRNSQLNSNNPLTPTQVISALRIVKTQRVAGNN